MLFNVKYNKILLLALIKSKHYYEKHIYFIGWREYIIWKYVVFAELEEIEVGVEMSPVPPWDTSHLPLPGPGPGSLPIYTHVVCTFYIQRMKI